MARDIEKWAYKRLGVVRERGSELDCDCPFCGKEGHFGVAMDKEAANCFHCGWHGSWVALIRAVENCSYGQALGYLEDIPPAVNEWLTIRERLGKEEPVQEDRTVPEAPTIYFDEDEAMESMVGRTAWNYISSRIPPEKVIQLGLGFCYSGRYALRIIIPIEKGFFQARSFVGAKPKYLSPAIPRNDILFNRKALAYDNVFVAEGAISTISLGDNAVGLLSKTPTIEQIRVLTSSDCSAMTVALDADALKEAWELAGRLAASGKAVYVREFDSGDPADNTGFRDVRWTMAASLRRRLSS